MSFFAFLFLCQCFVLYLLYINYMVLSTVEVFQNIKHKQIRKRREDRLDNSASILLICVTWIAYMAPDKRCIRGDTALVCPRLWLQEAEKPRGRLWLPQVSSISHGPLQCDLFSSNPEVRALSLPLETGGWISWKECCEILYDSWLTPEKGMQSSTCFLES